MRNLFFAVFMLCAATASAQVHECPKFYPDKDKPSTPITGGRIMWGELHGNGWLEGGKEMPVKNGYDTQFIFPEGQGWLVCLYGGRKRTRNDLGWPGDEWWTKLGPNETTCNLHVRESKSNDEGKSASSVTAICK